MATPESMKLVTAPAREPVSEDEAKSQLRVTHTDDDVEIARLIVAARNYVENYTRQRLVRQKWRLYFSAFSSVMELAPAVVREVEAIQYIDADGATQTVSAATYDVDVAGQRVTLAYGATWPAARYQANAVWLDVWAGMYDETASPIDTISDIEEGAKQAVLMVVQQFYDGEDGHGADMLLNQYRYFRLG